MAYDRDVAAAPSAWKIGDHLTHRSNPELGIGRVTAREGRALLVEFPRAKQTLRLAADTNALRPLDLGHGRPVRLTATGERTTIEARLSDGAFRLANGQIARADALWPLELEGALLERLALGDVDHAADFVTRLKILQLLALREADGLGSFLGGRIRLFPHQLYVAGKATTASPVRWLLADEVGLGKTIEAALILNRLVHTGRVERVLVVAPESLTVQWLGELWRKYHQVFTLLDAARLADVEKDFGPSFNPFDVHRRVVIALEALTERPELTERAVSAGIDLLVVDEAQRLRRPPGHPGEPAWRAVAPIAARGRHVLLLSATPLEDDAHGFFRLLQLLRPDEFPEDTSFDDVLASGQPMPPCTSSTRRIDIGGLPPRVGIAVPLEPRASKLREAMEQQLRTVAAPNAAARRLKRERIRRALASGAALRASLGGLQTDDSGQASHLPHGYGGQAGRRPGDTDLRQQCDAMDASDPRIEWLLPRARRWRDAGEKTLIFVQHRDTLEMVRTALTTRAQLASGIFHEELTTARRDTEVARFRDKTGPSLLISTEAGGEGRNFEFCRRLVLFDLPWKPTVIEQRIGRLDRIGRQLPVDIVYFRPPAGVGADAVRIFEALGIFREPLAGLEPQLAHIEEAIESLADDPRASLTDEALDVLVSAARAGRTRIREAAYQQLHRDPYRADMADRILARIPRDLDALNEEAVVAACTRLGFTVERPRGHRVFAIELGHEALVDSLPGVPGGASYVGSFDREEAVEDEMLDFFASGHPLVEGVFAHFDDSPIGRVAHLELEIGDERGEGLVALYKEAAAFEVVAVDFSGRLRPEWADAFGRRPFRARRATMDAPEDEWAARIRRLGATLDQSRRPHAIAAIVVRPRATVTRR
jgi:ATP-dependent helicase HepA